MPSDLHIWIDSMGGKKKGRVAGLGSLGRSMKPFSSGASQLETISEEVEERLRSEVHSFNTSLQAQLEKERQEKEEMRKELSDTRNTLNLLMEKLGFKASSSHSQPVVHDENDSSDEEDDEESASEDSNS